MKAEVEEMAVNGLAIVTGVGLSEHDHIGVVGSCVKPNCEPQTSRTAERQTPKEAVKRDADGVYPVLMRFKQEMEQSEERREQNCSWPEANALGQCCERIAPEQKFFCEAQGEHRHRPCNSIEKDLPAWQG